MIFALIPTTPKHNISSNVQTCRLHVIALLDALTVDGHVNSPVALSEETPYDGNSVRSSIRCTKTSLTLTSLFQSCTSFSLQTGVKRLRVRGYGVDTTSNERSEAKTLEERESLKKAQKGGPVRYDHKYSWLTRLINWGLRGWCRWMRSGCQLAPATVKRAVRRFKN